MTYGPAGSKRLGSQRRGEKARTVAGLALLSTLDGDERMAGHHRLLSVRAHLLEKTGDPAGAYDHYRHAAKATASIAERRYLESRASRVRSQLLSPSLH